MKTYSEFYFKNTGGKQMLEVYRELRTKYTPPVGYKELWRETNHCLRKPVRIMFEKISLTDEAEAAFNNAIASGRLSRDPAADNYAGHYMYMGPGKGGDAFKHSLSREYIA